MLIGKKKNEKTRNFIKMLSSFILKNLKKKNITKNQKRLTLVLKKIDAQEHEKGMMKGILNCRHTAVRDVMVPRVDVKAIEVTLTKKEIIEQIATSNHSRFPVYEENIDNVRGIVHLRDIFFAIAKGKKNINFEHILNEPFFVPESRLILDVLQDLQTRHLQLAVVVDEYGGFSGIISMEDILEEIIGDVQDEWDDDKENISTLSENKYSIRARTSLKEINEKLSMMLSDENADTLGGFVINLFGHVPRIGESIEKDNIVYKIKYRKRNSLINIYLYVKKDKNTLEKKK